MKVRKTELQEALTELQEALAAYSRTPGCSAREKALREALEQLFHTILKLIAKAGLYSPDTDWPDDLKGQLRRIVMLAQAALVRTYHADCPRCNKGMQSACASCRALARTTPKETL